MNKTLKDAEKSIISASNGIDDFTKQMTDFDKTIDNILNSNINEEEKQKIKSIHERSKSILAMGRNGNISGMDIALKKLRKQYGC